MSKRGDELKSIPFGIIAEEIQSRFDKFDARDISSVTTDIIRALNEGGYGIVRIDDYLDWELEDPYEAKLEVKLGLYQKDPDI